ncbi:hypothetical protein FRC17_005319 [Serendipita sp. 399]|nr:hypothetical protein FRC17_005319 [Serendipita sp. 399]
MFNLPPSTASASPAHFAPSFNRNPLARDRTPSPTPRRGASPPPIAKSPQRPGRTYSKSRSFLIELPHDTNAMNVDNPGELSPAAQNQDIDLKDIHRESYTELRSRWGIEHSEQDSAPINDLNSVGEMRSRGETRRFLDEVGYLFDGLDATTSNSSAKRASAIEIVSKMGDPDFQRRATAADFTGRAWKVLRTAGAGSGNDKARLCPFYFGLYADLRFQILDASLIAFVAIATKEAHQTHDLLKSKDLVTFLGTSIEIKSDEDVLISLPTSQEQAWARRHGLSRVDRTSLTALRAAIENSNILEKGTSVSHRLLASMSLLKISQLGQPFDAITTDAILMSLDHELSQLSVEDDPSDQLPFLNGLDLWHTYNCIKLLEHLASSLSSTSQTNNPIVSKLASFVSMWPVLVHEDYPIDFIGTTIEAALRYMIVVTHENPEWCEELSTTPTLIHNLLRLFLRNYHVYFSSPEATQGKDAKAVEEEEEDAGSTNLRTATLSLGLITQLIKQSSTARTHLRETSKLLFHNIGDLRELMPYASLALSKDCPAKGDCSRECTCKKRTSGLQCLVALFSHVHNGLDEQAEAQAHFIRGHIGVLLGYLYVYDTESRRPIIRTLKPHGQSDSEKLRALITLVREFCALLTTVMDKAAHQQETSSQTSGRDGGSDAPPALSLGDGSLDEGVQLAQEVIQGLEGLL